MEPRGHAPALRVMRDTEVRAARLPARARPLRTQAKMEPMEASIASTVGLLAGQLDCVHVHMQGRDGKG